MSDRNAKVHKKILCAGKGSVLEFRPGTKAVFHYETLWPLVDPDAEGFPESRDHYKSIDNTRKPHPDGYGKPLELVFGKKFQLPVFEQCLQTMLIDEVSQFDIYKSELYSYPIVSQKLRDISKDSTSDKIEKQCQTHCAASHSFDTGYKILNDLLKKPRSLRFIFHLLYVLNPDDYEPDSWQLEPEEKLASVSQLKNAGNEFLKKGEYESASMKYREALTRIDTLLLREKPGDPEWIELDKQNVPLFSNLSLCYLNWNHYYEAIDAATEVLKRDESNEKALYRRALGRISVWQLEQAEEDAANLLRLYPKNEKLVRTMVEKIQTLKKEREESRKSTYKNMFKK